MFEGFALCSICNLLLMYHVVDMQATWTALLGSLSNYKDSTRS